MEPTQNRPPCQQKSQKNFEEPNSGKKGSGQEGRSTWRSYRMMHYKIFHMISNLLIFHGQMAG
ncbi:hypothetical protein DESPIG_00791 [Desulfovibrio piger ATCC 29098]|uniref:Uncharacterized protein n=1 Tax=Desulfovibrio piger ATCC 29098 TaxID=411464 RepID=B6WRU8_9BACT|nr:hypothetical protein DESPIG_00791 [Desulfovibrio piger ATCC 29098]